jgi:hypothetical protein
MTDHHLLLPGAKTPVLISTDRRPHHWLRKVAIALGILAVLIGAADMLTRFSHTVFGNCAINMSFGPAISAIDPSAGQSAGGAAPCK